MATDVYIRLAKHLDNLPGGYPSTDSGVELRILRRLFAPEEAELALHLSLIPEEARVIARRAKIPVEEAARRLERMGQKRLIDTVEPRGKPRRFSASQFVVGFWEGQVNRLDRGLVEDFEEYLPSLFTPEVWRRAPQLRTVPVGESISTHAEVMPYERAEELVRAHRSISVSNCICRQEKRLLGEGCDKPLESCLSFGSGARHVAQVGRGRAIGQEEALAILHRAEQAGLVLQPGNAKRPAFLCTCCGCCCGVLRSAKRFPQPASLLSSPFVAVLDVATCEGCGTCETRCQMEAIHLEGDKAALDLDCCIGCGLCVATCPTGSLSLMRKPEAEQPYVPRNVVDSTIRLGRARGKMGTGAQIGMWTRSKLDRLLARR